MQWIARNEQKSRGNLMCRLQLHKTNSKFCRSDSLMSGLCCQQHCIIVSTSSITQVALLQNSRYQSKNVNASFFWDYGEK